MSKHENKKDIPVLALAGVMILFGVGYTVLSQPIYKAIAGRNLLEYLKTSGFEPDKVVVERNLEIVPRDELGNVTIQEEDSIEVLRFVGGG